MQHNPSVSSAVSDAELEKQLESILRRVPPIMRLPRPKERCPYTGQSRSALVELIAPCRRNRFCPPVGATYLKKNERARRGVWLIPAENLFRYLLAQGMNTAANYADMRRERKDALNARK